MEAQLEQLDGDRVRLTVEVPAGEVQHAVEHATHDLADRVKVPGFRAGKVPQQVLALADRQAAPLLRGGRVAHLELVLERRADEPRAADRAARLQLRPADGRRRGWQFTAEFAVQPAVEPADWTKLEVPKLEVEVTDEVVDQQLAALQEIDASLSPVDGRPARYGDVAVVDIVSDSGPGQRDYVVELGTERLVEEIEKGIRDLVPGEPRRSAGMAATGRRAPRRSRSRSCTRRCCRRSTTSFAHNASEFDTLEELRADIVEQIRTLLEQEVENRFRADAVDELIKATDVRPASLVVEMRTRDLINAFVRQLDASGIDPAAYLRAAGISGAELEQRLRAEAAQSIGRELVLEGVATSSGSRSPTTRSAPTCGTRARATRTSTSSWRRAAPTASGPTSGCRRAVDRIAAEVTPISQELASARESIWTPGKEEGAATEKKLWTPGS